MHMNYQQERLAYYKLPLSEKRVSVLALLKGLEGKAEVFDTLFEHILNNPDTLVETELDEVYESIISVLIEESEEKTQASISRLSEINSRLEQMRAQEQKERESEDASELLAVL